MEINDKVNDENNNDNKQETETKEEEEKDNNTNENNNENENENITNNDDTQKNNVNQIPVIQSPSGMPILFQPGNMIPMNIPQGIPINYPMNPMTQQFLGYNQMNEEEDDDDDDEPDPILDDDTMDLNTVNPFVLMENTALIVKKNLVERKWFLMKGDKILGNYNSEQLLFFLTSQIEKGNKFEDMSINDHTTDLHFKPSILYDTLRKYVPKLKKRYLKKVMEQNNEMMKKIQQQQMMQINQLNQIKMMQMNQMNIMKNNNNNNRQEGRNNINNQNNNQFNNNNQGNYNFNNHFHNNNYYNHMYNNNHGYNNMNYNQHQGGNYRNSNKKNKW